MAIASFPVHVLSNVYFVMLLAILMDHIYCRSGVSETDCDVVFSHALSTESSLVVNGSVIFIPQSVSVNNILNINSDSSMYNGVWYSKRKVSLVSPTTSLLIRQIYGGKLMDGTRVQHIHHSPYYGMSFPKSWIHSLVQLLERHNLKRVALLVESTDCTKQNVTVSLTKKLEIAGIFLHMTCVDLYSTIDLTIWRHLHTAIYLSMTTIISFVTPDTAFLLVEAGELLGMLTAHLYTWIFFELTSPQVKDFRLTFPNFYFNNVKTVRLLTNTSLRNTIISTTVEGECFLLDQSSLLDAVDYQLNTSTNDVTHYSSRDQLYVRTARAKKKPFIRLATLLYPALVITLPIPCEKGYCTEGMVCRIPSKDKNGVTTWSYHCCSGLIIELLQYIIRKIDVEYDLYVVEDSTFGGFINGSWTGIINDVYSGKADVGVQGLSVIAHRQEYIDFTAPILHSYLGIVRRANEERTELINWIFFVNFLRTDLLVAFIVAFLINFLVIFICENVMMRIHLTVELTSKSSHSNITYITSNRRNGSSYNTRYHVREGFSYFAGHVFQRDLGGKPPSFCSTRLPSIIFAIAMTIIMTSYTANVTAKNIVHEQDDGFRGLKDTRITHPSNDFVYSVMAKSSYELYIKKRPRMYDFIKNRLVPSDYIGVQHVAQGKLDGFFSDWTFLKYLIQRPEYCNKLTLYKETSKVVFSAFAVPKNSTWKNVFSKEILSIFELGLIQEMMNKWLFVSSCEATENKAEAFPWEHFTGLFLVMASSMFASVIVLVLENCLNGLYRKRKRRRIYQ